VSPDAAVAAAGRILRRGAAALLVLVAVLAGGAGVAAADPAVPTDFESVIDATTPALPDGVSVRVVGGDSFLELHADGHTVVVPDYGTGPDRAPYLRFDPDGTVSRNERSAAAQVNDDRYGAGATAPGGEPDWRVVSRDGRYAWHDHRIHWMSPSRPPLVDGTRQVDLGHEDGSGAWEVDLLVDGTPTVVRGRLFLHPAPSPVPWYALAAAAAAALGAAAVLVDRRGRPVPWTALAGAATLAATLATAAGWAQWRAIPADAGGTPVTAAVPAAGLLAALGAVAATARRGRLAPARLPLLAAAVAALGGWAIWRRDVLRRAILPTSTPGLDRVATALALGVAVALAAVLVWRPPGARPRRRPSPDGPDR